MSGFLLDTNVISELVRPRPDAKVKAWVAAADESLLYLSVLTLGEIRKGIGLVKSASRRAELEAWLEGGLRERFRGRILTVDEEIADRWGHLASQAPPNSLPVVDGLLAATAQHHNLTLVTRNTRDVSATGVALFNPWEG